MSDDTKQKHTVRRVGPRAHAQAFIETDGTKRRLKARGGHSWMLTPADAVRLREVPGTRVTLLLSALQAPTPEPVVVDAEPVEAAPEAEAPKPPTRRRGRPKKAKPDAD